MNGSSNLVDADQKPFALCPVCLRKLAYYLGFDGEEQDRYTKLRELFIGFNDEDKEDNFLREIKLMRYCTNKIEALKSSDSESSSCYGTEEGSESENEDGNEAKEEIYTTELNTKV